MNSRRIFMVACLALVCAADRTRAQTTSPTICDLKLALHVVCLGEPHPNLPLLAVGDDTWDTYQELAAGAGGRARGIPRGRSNPTGTAANRASLITPDVHLDPATFPESTLFAHLLEAYGEKREGLMPTPDRIIRAPKDWGPTGIMWFLFAAPCLPANEAWIPDRCTLEGAALKLHVTAWHGANSDPAPKQRMAYMVNALVGGNTEAPKSPLEPGRYSLNLLVEHLKQGPDGYFRATGETQTADLPFEVQPGAGSLFPRSPQPGTPPVALDPRQQAKAFDKDLKSSQGQPPPGPAFVRPSYWVGTVNVNAPDTHRTITVGQLRQPVADLLNAQGELTGKPELIPVHGLEPTPAADLYALLTSPTEFRPNGRDIGGDLASITVDQALCNFNFDVWPPPSSARTGSNYYVVRYHLIPLKFLTPGLHTLAIRRAPRASGPHTFESEFDGTGLPQVQVLVK
jgi:hypothetical protein